MKVIVCTGDSHTCGQGATGFTTTNDEEYNPFDNWHVNDLGQSIYAESIIKN